MSKTIPTQRRTVSLADPARKQIRTCARSITRQGAHLSVCLYVPSIVQLSDLISSIGFVVRCSLVVGDPVHISVGAYLAKCQ